MSEEIKNKRGISKKYTFSEITTKFKLSRYIIPFYRKKYHNKIETLIGWKKILKVK